MFYPIPFLSVTTKRSSIVARSAVGKHRHDLLARSLLMSPHTNKSLVESPIKDSKWLRIVLDNI
jgi:hypothetical protein